MRGWDESICAESCVFDRFGRFARAVVDLVGSCLSITPNQAGAPIIDLNDMRYERMLRANQIETFPELEELVMYAVGCFRDVIGKEGIIFTKDMLSQDS